VFLTADATREGDGRLAERFRARGLMAATVAGVIALGGIFVLRYDAPRLYAGLTTRAAPFVAVSAIAGLTALVLLIRRVFVAARVASTLAVVAVIWGWAVAQYPYLLVGAITVDQAAANGATLSALLISLVVGSMLLVPSLLYLYVLFQRSTPERQHDHEGVEPQTR
jgi:cytochrome d ubiquinol oxidase subunit II